MQNINFILKDTSSESPFNWKTSSKQYIKQINLFIQGKDGSLQCTGIKYNFNNSHKAYLSFEISSEVECQFYKPFVPLLIAFPC